MFMHHAGDNARQVRGAEGYLSMLSITCACCLLVYLPFLMGTERLYRVWPL